MKHEIKELGIDLRHYGIGTHKTTCPRCSQTRKKKHDTCLSVTVDHEYVVFNCHHCNFSGKKYSDENQKKLQNKFKKNYLEIMKNSKLNNYHGQFNANMSDNFLLQNPEFLE